MGIKKSFLILLLIISVMGCAYVISKDIRETVDKNVSEQEIFQDPEKYKGKIIILGGTIIQTSNTKEGTYIEVLEQERDNFGKPKEKNDRSLGRFIIFIKGYLDNAIYKPGSELTVAGEIIGKRVANIGEIEHTYPLIESKEIHLITSYPNYYPPITYGIGIGIERRF